MRFAHPAVLCAAVLASACGKAPVDANPDFSDATVYALRAFDAPDADLAFGLRALEQGVYLTMDVENSDVRERALTPSYLTEADLEGLETPDGADPANALPVAVAGLSPYDVFDNARIPLLSDQTVVEPYSPDKYDRVFLDGTEACWPGQDCDTLVTVNDLIKKNLLMEVPYILNKDFRWVDLGLPDPSTVPEGEEAVNEGDPRWAYVARSWMTESASGEGGNTIVQSYTIEVWIPRDGNGFVRDGTEVNDHDGEWTTDSEGGGTLRFLCVWAEAILPGTPGGDNPDTIAATTMNGIDRNYGAHEDWLDENVGTP